MGSWSVPVKSAGALMGTSRVVVPAGGSGVGKSKKPRNASASGVDVSLQDPAGQVPGGTERSSRQAGSLSE